MRRGRWRRSYGTALAVCSLTAAGCSGTTASPPTTSVEARTGAAAPVAPIEWAGCPGGVPEQCGTVHVPLDYRDPAAGSIPIAVTRVPSSGPAPLGALVFNPGGPGESGNQILPLLADRFPPAVLQSYDLVSFDPRGTGASDPLDCGTAPAAASSVLPVPLGKSTSLPGTPVYAAMARACHEREPELTPLLDTVATARDMDRIRQALGEPKLDYYGLSYGTVLGAVYADLFPNRVGNFVLDGAVDVGAELPAQANQEAPAAERSIDHVLASCAAVPPCPLGTDPRGSYRALAASLTKHPLPPPAPGDPYPVTVGDLDTAAMLTVSATSFTPIFYSALTAAEGGDGAPLRSLALQFMEDIDGAPLVDPLWAITCNDTAVHPGPTAAGTQARALAARYPLLGAYAVEYTMGGCVRWPAGHPAVTDIHPTNVPPILVVGNTGDPNTPIAGARHLSALIPGARLLTWDGWGHTWLLSGPGDACMQRWVSTYLTGGGTPPAHTVCS